LDELRPWRSNEDFSMGSVGWRPDNEKNRTGHSPSSTSNKMRTYRRSRNPNAKSTSSPAPPCPSPSGAGKSTRGGCKGCRIVSVACLRVYSWSKAVCRAVRHAEVNCAGGKRDFVAGGSICLLIQSFTNSNCPQTKPNVHISNDLPPSRELACRWARAPYLLHDCYNEVTRFVTGILIKLL
jgi:hypothetical protein